MDRHSVSEKAPNETDTASLDVVPGPHSSSLYQRPSHGGVHQHREASHHDVSHLPGEHHHPGEFHYLRDTSVSHHHPYGGVRQSHDKIQFLNVNLPRSLFPSSLSYGEDHSDYTESRYYHGNGKHFHSESGFHNGSHCRSGSHCYDENLSNNSYGGRYPQGRSDGHSEAYSHGEAHHSETHHQDEPYHRESQRHGGPSHQEEAHSQQVNEKSHNSDSHRPRDAPHAGEHPREDGPRSSGLLYLDGLPHGQHHHSEPRNSDHLQSPFLHTDIPGEQRRGEYHLGASQLLGPHPAHSMALPSTGFAATLQPSIPHVEVSGPNPSSTATHSAKASRKVYPQDTLTPEMENSPEDKRPRKHKVPRLQHIRKRRHWGLFRWMYKMLRNFIDWLRKRLQNLIGSLAFETFIFLIICLNTIMLVVQTFAEVQVRGEWYFMAMDSIFSCIYVVEAVVKIMALGFKYFSDPWNNLDFFIMIMAVLDFLMVQHNSSISHSVYKQSIYRVLKILKSLRALRAIRVMLRFSILTSFQEVTGTLVRSLPSIAAILILMFTCLFLFSVVLRALFHHSDPKRFRNIFTTLFTLFTMLTLDDWSLIYLDSWAQGAWYIIPILMIYIVIQYFIFLNLVIAVLVDNFQMALLKGLEKVKLERDARVHEKLLDDSLTELAKTEAEAKANEETKQKEFIKKKFGDMTEKQTQLLFHFLQLVAGVEYHQQKFRSQASVIDEIVDTTFEIGEEDFKK